jgi:hypothetical protein
MGLLLSFERAPISAEQACPVTKKTHEKDERTPRFAGGVNGAVEATPMERGMQRFSRREVLRSFAFLAAAGVFGRASPSRAAAKAPLAIKGYDPVAYFTMGKAVRGRPDIEYEWGEQRYWFARADHRELFKADPVRYAPQFPNFCAMALTRGELHEANPEHWLIADGKLYMFEFAKGPGVFRQNISENTAKANQNRALVQQK